jgi:hypothetical protein
LKPGKTAMMEEPHMLFQNPIASASRFDLHQLHEIGQTEIKNVEITFPEDETRLDESEEMLKGTQVTPIAFRMPETMGLGTNHFSLEKWKPYLETAGKLLGSTNRFLIVHGACVPLGQIFEYLDAHPREFHALQDYKTEYVKTATEQIHQLLPLAKELNLQLLLENAPMGNEAYFEPGRSMLYPALRTPHHLLQIAEKTGIKLCFNTANARIATNVLTYMHRSRSMFAGATEKEILSSPSNWIFFYDQIKHYVGFIRLSYAVSWGDLPETTHIPFPESAYDELLFFAETVNENLPVSLAVQNEHALRQMLHTLHALKKR